MQEIIKLRSKMVDCLEKRCDLNLDLHDMGKLVPAIDHVLLKYNSNFELLKILCTMLKYHYPYETIQIIMKDIIINSVKINFGELTVIDGEIPNIIRLNFSLSLTVGGWLDSLMEEIEKINADDMEIDDYSYKLIKNILAMMRDYK